MANKKTANLLPEYLKSNKNSKFLSSTLDQLIQTPELERIDGYVGSKDVPNYDPKLDNYLSESNELRDRYQLEPALVIKDETNTITDVIGYDDLINELTGRGAQTNNLDKLFNTKFYSYDPLIDLDKLINYTSYYWLPRGPDSIIIDNSTLRPQDTLDVATGAAKADYPITGTPYSFTNGMKVTFTTSNSVFGINVIKERDYFVEGVGKSITLVPYNTLTVGELFAQRIDETYDSEIFDSVAFDGDDRLPITPEYITINRASVDLNSWSRYNRWVHGDVISMVADINGAIADYSLYTKAQRPIIEFIANLQLYKFGNLGIPQVNILDDTLTNAFNTINNSYGYYVDQIELSQGQRVIFNADENETVRQTIYEVNVLQNSSKTVIPATNNTQITVELSEKPFTFTYFPSATSIRIFLNSSEIDTDSWTYDIETGTIVISGTVNIDSTPQALLISDKIKVDISQTTLLIPQETVSSGNSVAVLDGAEYGGTSWYFDSDTLSWSYSQQHTELNQSPLFDLFDINGDSYTLPATINDFEGTKIFGYAIGNGTPDTVLGFPLTYKNGFGIGSFTFQNYFMTDTINYTTNNVTNIILVGNGYIKINDPVDVKFTNVWKPVENYQPQNENEVSLSLTNNPLNGPISTMTLSELGEHLATNDTRFIVNANPIVFTELFLATKKYNAIDSIRYVADQYNQFKMNLINSIVNVDSQMSPADALDYVLKNINKDKDNKSPYYRSDMIAYGSDHIVNEYTVGVVVNNTYPLPIEYNSTKLSFSSVLIYLNGTLLTKDVNYTFDDIDSTVSILETLVTSDKITIVSYKDTSGAYIPSTPSKLGMYPKFIPEIYSDTSYADAPVDMIRGHDGSTLVAYGDYRDAIILEYEKRVYNNIKVTYNSKIFDVMSVIPGAFRNPDNTATATNILRQDFIKWAGIFNVDISTNSSFDEGDYRTWNLIGSVDTLFSKNVSGTWKAVYTYFYDTVRPHTHPWEMLGFVEEPTWWVGIYGAAPYLPNNPLWTDLKNGFVREPGASETRPQYARPNLLTIIPVDTFGNLLPPTDFLVSDNSRFNKSSNWMFGDYSPAEVAWRNSSYWPFCVNILSAVLYPLDYASSMYDVSRVTFNSNNQIIYNNDLYLNPKKLIVDGDNNQQIAGFGTYIVDKGLNVDYKFVSKFVNDLTYFDINLFHKLSGFTSKDKVQIIVDSIDPTSASQGGLLPPEDYSLILNVSNPIKSSSISGIIIQKSNGKFVVRGYDRETPFFNIFKPISALSAGAITVGGKEAPFSEWSGATETGNGTTRFYKQGQIVRYNNRFYIVKTSHTAQAAFDITFFQQLPKLPITGGASANLPSSYESSITSVPYGTSFSSIQEVFDLLMGYGEYLKTEGFIFDEYNAELFEVLNWQYTGKEFLFWSTQNWADGNLITLSPFSNSLKYAYTNSIVDNITSSDYEYSLLKADGTPFPIDRFNLNREDGICTINTVDTFDGIYFAKLYSIQKEHAMVFNNRTIFNDTIYDIESGYRQHRVKLSGFRTANWNGDLYSPGFVFDSVEVTDWKPYTLYNPSTVVSFNGAYYESKDKFYSTDTFDFTKWDKLQSKPVPNLIPNFDYKITQFEDFYSLDIDNFDSNQQALSQHLVGYAPRPYLTNLFTNPTTQYKFYQGFIREKGTRNAVDRIAKTSNVSQGTNIDFGEEWAFRIGHYGGYQSYNEYEFALDEGTSLENPYVVKFTADANLSSNNLIQHIAPDAMLVSPTEYIPASTFPTVYSSDFEDTNLKLNTAGYVRLDDVTTTAYNKNSLLEIATGSDLQENDTIWEGFSENGDWTVYRYAIQSAKISGVFVNAPASSITFVTNLHHGLEIGDVVSVVRFNDQVDGVYVVNNIPLLNHFEVSSTLSTIVNEELAALGALYTFNKVRYSSVTDLASVKELIDLPENGKVWVDRATDSKWAVYQKTNNYSTGTFFNTPASPAVQELGYKLFSNEDSAVVLAALPSWQLQDGNSIGKVWVLEKYTNRVEKKYEIDLNTSLVEYCGTATETNFGYSLNHDVNKNLFFVGAPAASNIVTDLSGTVVFSTGTGTVSSFTNQGLVKISFNDTRYERTVDRRVLISPSADEGNNTRFGQSIYINSVPASTATTLLVGSPGATNGKVYAYYVNIDSENTVTNILEHDIGIELVSPTPLGAGANWGEKISGSTDGKFIAISAPYPSSPINAFIGIFNENLVPKYYITPDATAGTAWGDDVVVSSSGKFLFVSSTRFANAGVSPGIVEVYKVDITNTASQYTLHQTINNPVSNNNLNFGASISLSDDETVLVISALGENRSKKVTFDTLSSVGETTFDSGSTEFFDSISDAGAVYVFNNLDDVFVPATELNNANIIEDSKYGTSVVANNDIIFVGAPSVIAGEDGDDSTFFVFDKLDKTINSWNILRQQPNLVDVESIKRVVLIDSIKEEITEYLDVVDPLKGKIVGIAEQELSFKSPYDPAVYSIGIQNTTIDNDTNWIDEQVGKLWWDLSTAKYTWYEQGDELFRKNNWGKLFPGASIDIYEWVKSDLLPAEWALQADTNTGLTLGISGQPKYPDNSVVSVKQIYNNVTNAFENVYYYWVKNKTTLPDVKNRRMNSAQVASIITDPTANGVKFIEVLSNDSVAFANVQPTLVGSNITANIAIDTASSDIPRHTEWILLQEGDSTSVPTTLLTKKLIDSLLGHDSLGNSVPDISLSYREKYGIGIRPQQTMFKNRTEAIRNIVEFSNKVLRKNLITGNYSFNNLNLKEELPDIYSNEYDLIVNVVEDLIDVTTTTFIQASIRCTSFNGKIVLAEIVSSGQGYLLPPKITVDTASGTGAVITSTINSVGEIVSLTIESQGGGYTDVNPNAVVRPHTAYVIANSNIGNIWSKHEYDYVLKEWYVVKTQSYNTTRYWNYVDWASDDYNGYKDYKAILDDSFSLSRVSSVETGDYVKINNIGDNRYVIIEKLPAGEIGNFSTSFNIVYSEKGTIQISDALWNGSNSNYSYDILTLEETLYDQIPDLELQYILFALKDDIFIRTLKVNWNLLFFAAVKYALTEQKLLDWAFKTSFITVDNTIGALDQPSVYRINNEVDFEEYIREIKPYRTQIRNYTSSYTAFDEYGSQGTPVTDFDQPAFYNTVTNAYELVNFNNVNTGTLTTPWSDWFNNYKYSVGEVKLAYGGKGYNVRPSVSIIAAPGDTGTGAKAEAYISNGSIFKVVVTDPGKGYTMLPTIAFSVYTELGGTFEVYDGLTRVTENITFSVVPENTTISINIDPATGVYTINDLYATNGTALLRAVYTGGGTPVTIDKMYLVNKSTSEVVGSSDRSVVLVATPSQVVEYDIGGNPIVQPVNITAIVTADSEDTYYEFLVGQTSVQNTLNQSYAYNPQPEVAAMPDIISVNVRLSSSTGPIIATDTITMIGIKDEGGVTGYLTNEKEFIQSDYFGNSGIIVDHATASVILKNDTIRKNNTTLRFDRVGLTEEISNARVSETFPPSSGNNTIFELSWLAEPVKSTIVPLLDGKLVLATDYTIEYFKSNKQGYTATNCRFVFLNYVPEQGQVFTITYNKNIDIYTAVDRIHNMYNPTDTMVGNELPLLMTGAEYGARQVQGLSFGYSPAWDQGAYDSNSVWNDVVEQYASVKVVQDVLFGDTIIYVDSIDGVSVGQRVLLTSTSTNHIRPDTVITSINTTSIEISDAAFGIKKIVSPGMITSEELLIVTTGTFNSYIRKNDIVELRDVTPSEFNGTYSVQQIGINELIVIGTGTNASTSLTTSSVTAPGVNAIIYVPSILSNILVNSTYLMYYSEDTIVGTGTASTATLSLPNYAVDQVSNISIYSTEYSGVLDVGSYTIINNIISLSNTTTTTYQVSVYGYPILELWKDSLTPSDADTALSAGSWNSSGEFVGALGVNPSEFIVDGSGFLDAAHGFAPEEHVKGQTFDSLSVNVYTQSDSSSGVAVSGSFGVNTDEVTIVPVGMDLATSVGVLVHYDGIVLNRITAPPYIVNEGPNFKAGVNAEFRPISGAPIEPTAGDDSFTGPYPLGFTWNMFGTSYTDVYVGTNGYLTFGGGSSDYTPVAIDQLPLPAIFVEYCDLWQDLGTTGQGLTSGRIPGLHLDTGIVGEFSYWRLRFDGTHYDYRNILPTMPDFTYEVTLYSDGRNQYIEMIYGDAWRNSAILVPTDVGFVTGVAGPYGNQSVQVNYNDISDNSSYVFFSTSDGGNWGFAGYGSFDAFKNPFTFSQPNQYFVYGRNLYIAPQTTYGRGGYSVLSMGGEHIIDSNMTLTDGVDSVLLSSAALYDDVQSVYVTVNGRPISTIEGVLPWYELTYTGNTTKRAAAVINNLSLASPNTCQVWFLKIKDPKFNTWSQEALGFGTAESTEFVLTYPPAVTGPTSSQAIVELYTDDIPLTRKRLSPPWVSYYHITNDEKTFLVDNRNTRAPGTYNSSNVRVYGNGSLLRPGFDYTLDSTAGTITLQSNILGNNDIVAIEVLIDYDYLITPDGVLHIYYPMDGEAVTVLTFPNHDNLMLRTDRFESTFIRQYVLNLPAINDNYIWVYVNGKALTAGYDFDLLDDRRTVVISNWIEYIPGEEVLITSINSPYGENVVLGYRIFKDMFDRVSYSRISDFYSTRLTKELDFTDTEINVLDASRLITPNPAGNQPGVIFIDSERIEFFRKSGNVLSDLRRSTLGTAPANYTVISTKVIDQSRQQQMLGNDEIHTLVHITSSTTGTYVLAVDNTYTMIISKMPFEENTGTMYYSRSAQGIALSTSTDINLSDEVIVKYGGRVLRKSALEVAVDASSISTVILPPEFTITYNTTTGNQELLLNISGVTPGVQVEVEQKVGQVWSTNSDMLLVSDSVQANFIRSKPTSLPDIYYYGGSPVLTDYSNFELTDDQDNPIEGY